MGSKNPPPTFYVSALRSRVKQAFDATWTALQARDPFRDFERDYELKATLRRKLMGLDVDGVTDPIKFREWALEGRPRGCLFSTPESLSAPANLTPRFSIMNDTFNAQAA